MENLIEKWRKEVENLKKLEKKHSIDYEKYNPYTMRITQLLICIDDYNDEYNKVINAFDKLDKKKLFGIAKNAPLADVSKSEGNERKATLTAFNEWLENNHSTFVIPDMILQDYIKYGG